ncbi:hypothetical protein TrispH2_005031 [Trichoplax sp. H2]|nr:hypothetical protein TrispH2_005031 [Trichoplax sp. H2]|eukprot:RDD43556.1 hypothetical protein TrispH2_005031 [Trichoplax sp. H2]
MKFMIVLFFLIAGISARNLPGPTVTNHQPVELIGRAFVVIDVAKDDFLVNIGDNCLYRRINKKRMRDLLNLEMLNNQTIQQNKTIVNNFNITNNGSLNENQTDTNVNMSTTAKTRENWSREEIYEMALKSNLQLWSTGGLQVEVMTRRFRKRPEFFSFCMDTEIYKVKTKESAVLKSPRCRYTRCRKSQVYDYNGKLAFIKYNCLILCFSS